MRKNKRSRDLIFVPGQAWAEAGRSLKQSVRGRLVRVRRGRGIEGWMNSHHASRARSIKGDASQYPHRSAPSLPRKVLTTSTAIRISTTMRSKLAARVWSRRLKGLWGGSLQDHGSANPSKSSISESAKNSK